MAKKLKAEKEVSFLTPAQKKELDERVDNHEKGKSKSYSWSAAKKKIVATAKRKSLPLYNK